LFVAAVVLVICALLFCNAAPSVEALTPSPITPTTSTANPPADQPFTLSGTLTAGSTPLSGKVIKLSRGDSSGHWSGANYTTTDANGAYTIPRTESAQDIYTFQAIFAGGDAYAPANATVSLPVGNFQVTEISIFSIVSFAQRLIES